MGDFGVRNGGLAAGAVGVAAALSVGLAPQEPSPEKDSPDEPVKVEVRVLVCEEGAPRPHPTCKPTYGTTERPTAWACRASLKVSAPRCEIQPVLDPMMSLGAGSLDGDTLGIECPPDTRC